jgi:hypothetical protein
MFFLYLYLHLAELILHKTGTWSERREPRSCAVHLYLPTTGGFVRCTRPVAGAGGFVRCTQERPRGLRARADRLRAPMLVLSSIMYAILLKI